MRLADRVELVLERGDRGRGGRVSGGGQLGERGEPVHRGGGARDLVDEPLACGRVALVAQQPARDGLALEALHDDPRAVARQPVGRGDRDAGVARRAQRGELARTAVGVLEAGRVAAKHERVALGAGDDVERVELARRSARQRHQRLDGGAGAEVRARLRAEGLVERHVARDDAGRGGLTLG